MNFDTLSSKDLTGLREGRAGCLAGQVISPAHVDDWFCPYLGKKGCGRTCDPLTLHCGWLLRPQLLSTWPYILSKHTHCYFMNNSFKPLSIPSHGSSHPDPSWKIWEFFSMHLSAIRAPLWSIPECNYFDKLLNRSSWPTFCMRVIIWSN